MNPYSPPADLQPYPAAAPPYPVAAGTGAGAVSEATVLALRQTRPWVMFLSILAFIGSAFMLLAGLFMMGVALLSGTGVAEKGLQALIGAIYLPLAVLYIYPGIKLWTYGSAIGRLMSSGAVADLEAALAQQKSFWKFSGIAAIVMIALYMLFFVAMIVAGVATGLGKM
jgi:hypothetical protein